MAILVAAVGLLGCSDRDRAAPPAAPAFEWPVPAGWRTETIPFPLEFAPAISHRGVEELRFSPGMFEPGRDDFWTYAFVWWLEGDVPLDTARLNTELVTYLEGLSRAVEKRKDFDPKQAAVVAELAPVTPSGAGTARSQGPVASYDAFATHARIELNVEVDVFRCRAENRTVALFLVSPQPAGHPVWKQLEELRRGFRCARP